MSVDAMPSLLPMGSASLYALDQLVASEQAGWRRNGWFRGMGHKAYALAGGRVLSIVGRVSMDSAILNISTLPADMLKPGDFVEPIGPHRSIDDVAAAAGTIGYEILISLGTRYARRTLG